MENDQVANEKADYQVKDSLDNSKISDFFFITLIVRQDIKQNAENSFKKHYYYERKKHSIVLFSNAVIQPHTMMVKLGCAPIAFSTMLRKFFNIGLTNVTEKFVAVLVKI